MREQEEGEQQEMEDEQAQTQAWHGMDAAKFQPSAAGLIHALRKYPCPYTTLFSPKLLLLGSQRQTS